MGANSLASMAEIVPFGIANQAARVYTRYNMSKLHKPVFNLTITNVPGPQFPLYLAGHKLLSVMGAAPIIDGMGLIITVFSYDGHITISSTSDAKTMPDIDIFSKYIREAANELEALVLAKKSEIESKKDNQPKSNSTDSMIDKMRKKLTAQAKKSKLRGVVELNVSSPSQSNWKFDFKGDKSSIRKSKAKDPDVKVNIKDAHLKRILDKDLNLEMALVQGRLKIEGDQKKAKAFGKYLQSI